jgi:hypothetical protein
MSNQYPRGSEWRKWDLQVQTRLDAGYSCLGLSSLTADQLALLKKETGLTDVEITSQEKTISPEKYAKLFVAYVTNFTDIGVVAITDHNTGKELDSLLQEAEKIKGRLTILTGVEISSTQGIHILCIFDPQKKWKDTWAESIAHFLTELGISGTGFGPQGQPISSTKNAQQILELTEQKGGLCIFAHIETDNGLFKSSTTANGGTAHIDIYTHRLCQIVQLPQNTSVSVGTKNIIEGKNPQYGSKTVTKIKCSDSRKLSDIGNNFVWIKADPTFEGLKQIIFEPDERVKVQPLNPYEDRNKVYFNKVKLSGSTNFLLPDFELLLNRELVAIIGGRGSGKSALLDTFALLNEEHLKADRNNKKKIIEYYRGNEGRTEPPPSFSLDTTLIDKDNVEHNFSKTLGDYTNLELPFLYLGQEQLSGIATNDFELTKTVCQLIGIDANEIGQESLISRARAILSGIDNTEKLIIDIIQRYVALGYPQTVKIETWIKGYLVKLKEQQKRLSSKETRTILEDINKKTQQGLKLKELSEKAEALLGELKSISVNQSVKNFNTQLKKIYADFPTLAILDSSEQVVAIGTIKQKIKTDMDELRKDIVSQKQALIKQGIKEDVNSLLQASENLQKQIGGLENDLQGYEDAQEQLKILYQERNNQFSEIKEILEKLKDSITNAFIEFKGSRTDSSQEEKELFEKIISGIGVEGQVIFDEKIFIKKVLATFIDNRKIPSEAELKKNIAGENSDGTSKDISFDNLTTWIQSDLSSEKYFNRGGLKGLVEFVFTEWPSFLRVKAVAKLNGKPTEVLSIGQRGTLLLKVYLATSTAKQVFIIDQPEDNLDNNFIMHELVPLIRRAKRSRQIIMSTHNANLVINADAEQIVVALLDQNSSYLSGSIENSDINNIIKDTLEGGEQAFIQRERKYQIGL